MLKNKVLLFLIIFVAAAIMLLPVAKKIKRKISSNTLTGEALVEWVKLDCPKSVKQGEVLAMYAYFKPIREIAEDYKLFVHIYGNDPESRINADRLPVPSTSQWKVGEVQKIGPIQVIFGEDAPPGSYKIDMGLFSIKRDAKGPQFVRYPYSNKSGYRVGAFNLERGRKTSVKEIFDRISREAFDKFGTKDYAVAIESSMNKVFRPLDKFSSPVGNEVSLSAAKNEYESFQVILLALAKDLENPVFSVSEFRKKDDPGVFLKNIINVRTVGYVKTGVPDYPVKFVGLWPDPLLSRSAASIKRLEAQPFWSTVHVPADALSGDYEGMLRVKPGNAPAIDIKITLHVFNFRLPDKPTLRTSFLLYSSYIARYHKVSGKGLLEKERLYYDTMLAHRISPTYIYGNPRETRDKMGTKILSFDEFEQNLDFCLARGLNGFSIARKWGGENDNKWGNPSDIRETLLCYADLLKSRQLTDMAYIYAFDEPGPSMAPRVRETTKLIHEIYPDFKNMITASPDPVWGEDIDIWCPRLANFNYEDAAKERAKGKAIWWYVSSAVPGTPGFNVDMDAIEHRIVFWMSWKYSVEGFLYWCINYWKQNPWENIMTWRDQNGNGCLIYPGETGPVDTIRLEVIRDGIEDYEYFAVLKRLRASLEADPLCASLVNEAGAALSIDNGVVAGLGEYTRDPRVLLEKREQLGELIEKLNAALEEKNKT